MWLQSEQRLPAGCFKRIPIRRAPQPTKPAGPCEITSNCEHRLRLRLALYPRASAEHGVIAERPDVSEWLHHDIRTQALTIGEDLIGRLRGFERWPRASPVARNHARATEKVMQRRKAIAATHRQKESKP